MGCQRLPGGHVQDIEAAAVDIGETATQVTLDGRGASLTGIDAIGGGGRDVAESEQPVLDVEDDRPSVERRAEIADAGAPI